MTPRGQLSSGYIVWFTGLSGSGKSTLATALGSRLEERSAVEILDGDELRKTICSDLGYSRDHRNANVDRIAWVSRLLARHGIAALVAAISPYRDARLRARCRAAAEDIPFIEVFVHAPLGTLIARDTKGLYARALAGTLAHFTGVSDPYEEPGSPELVLQTDSCSVTSAVDELTAYLSSRGLISRGPR